MVTYAIVDVHHIADYLEYQQLLAPLLEAAGARYLARGGDLRHYECDFEPSRLMVVEFPSLKVWMSSTKVGLIRHSGRNVMPVAIPVSLL